MKSTITTTLSAAVSVVMLVPAASLGQVTRIDLQVVESPALDGERFGEVGNYERLRGTVYGAVDPADPRHREIVNLDQAPRNARGRVEYSTTVEIYRPVDMSRWNRTLYHTVPNRGGAGVGPPALLERGFALVRVGWKGDLVPTDTNIVPSLPVARNADGSSIAGSALEEFIFNDAEPVSNARLTYKSASLDPEKATLTVRRSQEAPRLTPKSLSGATSTTARSGLSDPPSSTAAQSTSLSTKRRTRSSWVGLCGDAGYDLLSPV